MALLGSAHAKDACRMLVKLTTGLCQCAKDCGPHKCTHIYANPSNPSRPSSFIKIFPEFKKKISMVEELSEPTKHANRITIPIFLIMKATILDKCGTKQNFYPIVFVHCLWIYFNIFNFNIPTQQEPNVIL